ncbi:MAG TPA: S49 family peptidase [Marinobacter sp.]|uniref:S49 family peptidase n=1 Tax=Marinobacter sp. TaxID=50741 RepID=UPI000EE0B4FB|nr:S49 family peptidase [Marinobacter sp.]MBC7192296.1 S49 family peptidase [Marinobacter sp.]HCW90399.1 S49 family peptidase [Marinobacter sp.]
MSDWENDKNPGWGAPDESGGGRAGRGVSQARQESQRDWKLIEKLVMSLQSEQRKSRRWGVFFKLLTFGYLFALLYLIQFSGAGSLNATAGRHTALIEVTGPIAAEELASADNIVGSLQKAFKEPDAVAVILRINSPGGSPVQAGYIYDEIKRLRGEYPDKKVYAVISDIGASGAYYIAAAADQIYADQASLVGSIGVVSGGFGFTGIMDKLGIERRLYTAGANKAFLDPFSPEEEQDVAFWQQVLETTHRQFIEKVREGRGDRLADDDRLFSGLVWTGEQALELGLVDGLGSSAHVARQIVGEKELVDYSHQPSPLRNLVDQLGVSVGEGVARYLSEARFELR